MMVMCNIGFGFFFFVITKWVNGSLGGSFNDKSQHITKGLYRQSLMLRLVNFGDHAI